MRKFLVFSARFLILSTRNKREWVLYVYHNPPTFPISKQQQKLFLWKQFYVNVQLSECDIGWMKMAETFFLWKRQKKGKFSCDFLKLVFTEEIKSQRKLSNKRTRWMDAWSVFVQFSGIYFTLRRCEMKDILKSFNGKIIGIYDEQHVEFMSIFPSLA